MRKSGEQAGKPQIATDITRLKSIGELSVFKIYSKEIVTRKQNVGSGLLGSLVSPSSSSLRLSSFTTC